MGPIVFVAILLILSFGNFETLRPVPLLWWVGGGGGGGGAYFGVCCGTTASAKFLMGTQNHEFSHTYSFILTENLGGD